VFYHGFSRSLDIVVRSNRVPAKFYEDEPQKMVINPEFMKRLSTLYIMLHVFGLFISIVKMILLRRIYDIVIEEEGFVFKDINLLFSLLSVIESKTQRSIFLYLLDFVLRLIARSLASNSCIVRLTAPYTVLRKRYSMRGTHIEPRHYVLLQEAVFNVMQRLFPTLFVTVIDTSRLNPLEVAREISRILQHIGLVNERCHLKIALFI
jgi:deoxyadenosine/deoxycytidine kinase